MTLRAVIITAQSFYTNFRSRTTHSLVSMRLDNPHNGVGKIIAHRRGARRRLGALFKTPGRLEQRCARAPTVSDYFTENFESFCNQNLT